MRLIDAEMKKEFESYAPTIIDAYSPYYEVNPFYIEELKRTLKKVTEQRDMAINDLYELAQESSKRCEYCKFNKSGCDWCIYDPDEELNFVWRGMIEEKTK